MTLLRQIRQSGKQPNLVKSLGKNDALSFFNGQYLTGLIWVFKNCFDHCELKNWRLATSFCQTMVFLSTKVCIFIRLVSWQPAPLGGLQGQIL